MRLSIAFEKLIPRERARFVVATRERYGRNLSLSLFGHRLIVDLAHRKA